MMKCKVISGKNAKSIENDVNEWLTNNSGVQIRFITQGGAGNVIITTIFYE